LQPGVNPVFGQRSRLKIALTDYRLVTPASGTIVDAAHIHQFASSRNNAVGPICEPK